MSSYATLTDLITYGLPSTALGQISSTVQQNSLDEASSVVDTYLRARYSLPLTAWGVEITQAVCRIAAYNLLSVRGYNPAAGADINIRDRYLDAIAWLNKVQKQQAHPEVTPASGSDATLNQPTVITSSVVNVATGGTSTNRGW